MAGSSPAMTKREWTYLTVFGAGARSGWPRHMRQACAGRFVYPRAGRRPPASRAVGASARRGSSQILLRNRLIRGHGRGPAGPVTPHVVERHDRAVPDVRMDIEPAAAAAPERDEPLPLRRHTVPRQGERHDETLAVQRIEQLAAVGVIIGAPDQSLLPQSCRAVGGRLFRPVAPRERSIFLSPQVRRRV